MIWAKTKM